MYRIDLTGRRAVVVGGTSGIGRATAELPGFTNTEMTEIYDSNTKSAIAEAIPARTWASPDQIAGAALFLASPLADYIHGVNLPVDGGYLAAGPA